MQLTAACRKRERLTGDGVVPKLRFNAKSVKHWLSIFLICLRLQETMFTLLLGLEATTTLSRQRIVEKVNDREHV